MVPLEFLKELPKCEHHLHIEGTLEPELLFKFANRNKITLPNDFPTTVKDLKDKYNFNNLQEFLDLYYVGANVLITEQDFYELTMAYFKRVSKQGLVHAEIFYDPQTHTSRDISLDIVTRGIERACKDAQKQFGVTYKIIMCLLRHTDPKDCSSLIDDAAKYIKDGTISGIGLDSSEKNFPPALFVECYEKAIKLNPDIKLTAHAGEEGPASYVSDALDLLKVHRIDHGVRSADDDALLERLAEEKIMLSICPLSNVKLQVVEKVSQLPLQKFLDYGVPFSINSDDPAYFGGYLLDNYIQLSKEYPQWGFFTWGQIVKNGITHSWIDEKRKEELINEVDGIITKYVNRSG
ncbi:hypothetical protein Kpol_1035p29 [Vanderwaltozyma polyspora DSM 70294]|uniref:Adenine deaminase n=1 Tax=Vanderwaltozyma polyspora (strain ATCC 22028 / DSM 70294 / BCRC 21397 / CBS 2163 / NBRC 10782 / NRRL Y-8283 / UCD 57-17) TaxID=436907 RepID=A7TKJ4_VANPO|nr:uncharacterized protein Kpol_1035p29 [Vanderwaltozyma polyspora DSM 70294]EDO17216.1 hypothetical protein Kpol_1035p29 [Vanderwaltozyma polyspora DSM 70294]